MRKISADYIFPISSEPIPKGIITIDENGLILNVETETENQLSDIEFYHGVICPGFVNTHCHLELSHLRFQIAENQGMAEFIKQIISKRDLYSESEIQQAIVEAEAEMIKEGIVAVGDISNNNSTFNQKAKNNLYYHTFFEVFDLNPEKAEEVFKLAASLRQQLSIFNLSSSIVPHSPYSVSDLLFQLIFDDSINNNSILSIHNQESQAENELFISATGAMFETFSKMGINMNYIKKTGLSSLQSILHKLPVSQKKLFVHNTFTTKHDIEFMQLHSNPETVFWCTCPNANLYIEGKLPNYNDFIDADALITVGTDSLASNRSLSVLNELKTITKHYSKIPLQTLLLWATKNGADFLGLKNLGTIEKGKTPGIILLENIDGLLINNKTTSKRLI